MVRSVVCSCVFASLWSISVAHATKGSFVLKRQPRVGASSVYHLNAHFEFGGEAADMSMDQTETVTKLDQNGDYEVESVPSNGHMEADGKTKDLADGRPSTESYSADGVLLTLHPSSEDSTSRRKANMLAFIAPDKAVPVGYKWQKEWEADDKTAAALSQFEFQGIEKIDGIEAARVHYSYQETSGDSPIESDGDEWVSTADGSIVKIDAKFKNFPLGASGAPVEGTLLMERK